jgi:hypothetical protein
VRRLASPSTSHARSRAGSGAFSAAITFALIAALVGTHAGCARGPLTVKEVSGAYTRQFGATGPLDELVLQPDGRFELCHEGCDICGATCRKGEWSLRADGIELNSDATKLGDDAKLIGLRRMDGLYLAPAAAVRDEEIHAFHLFGPRRK